MSTYRYILSDYHAVKSADIIIDGITVLAGENGCGKSTLSRWLYYMVNGSKRFEQFMYREYIRAIEEQASRWEFVSRDFRRFSMSHDSSDGTPPGSLLPLRQSLRQFKNVNNIDEQCLEKIEQIYVQMLHSFGEQLALYLGKIKEGPRRERILSYLKVNEDNTEDVQQIVESFMEKNMRLFNRITSTLQLGLENRVSSKFFETIRDNFDETDEAPNNIQLYEDNVELINGEHVSALFNLQRAVYVDTPMALMNDFADNVFWDELRNLVLDKKAELEYKEKKILHRIKRIIHGEVRLVETDSPFSEEELRYISSDNKVNIEIEKTATGFKTFTYLQRLLENGYLNSETLLLIDEPEAHLHPQWIVEYANLLVLLSKELGLKIVLASHNPDMVAAIRAIAEHEEMLKKTHFYIANSTEDDSYHYVYKDLGGEIGEIFTSFNIALSRIQSYGTSDLQ